MLTQLYNDEAYQLVFFGGEYTICVLLMASCQVSFFLFSKIQVKPRPTAAHEIIAAQ